MSVDEASVALMSHGFLYGTGVFEGIRAYANANENVITIFRLDDHLQRLRDGSRLLGIDIDESEISLAERVCRLVGRFVGAADLYLRPVAYKSGRVISTLLTGTESALSIIALPATGLTVSQTTARLTVSSWRRAHDASMPPGLKCTGAYVNVALAKTEAARDGYDDAILLNHDGFVAEATTSNLFLVRDGVLHTPARSEGILAGITRDTVISLAREVLGLEVVERRIARVELYSATECFLTGTAAEIRPVGQIDKLPVGSGKRGEVTQALQQIFTQATHEGLRGYEGWRTPVALDRADRDPR